MPLHRFQLLDLKRDEGARTFEAREIATGRPVLVHLFADRTSPLNRALLAKVDALPEAERQRVIDRGHYTGGVIYLVTDRLPEYPGLREWLAAKSPEEPKELKPRDLNLAGPWQVPKLPPLPAPNPTVDDQIAHLFDTVPRPIPESVPGVGAPDTPVLTNTGEQTLQMPAVPKQPEPSPISPIEPAPVLRPAPSNPPPPPANQPGEFTQQFAPVLRPTPPVSSEPGEFTRQFSAPAAPQKPAQQPGEFTKLFQRPNLTPSPRVPPPASPQPPNAPQPAQPGEFTQMLQAQRPAPPAIQANKPSQSGEFASYFQSPLTPSPQGSSPSFTPPPMPPQAPRGAGEFTQVFGRGDIPAPPPQIPPPPRSGSNDATEPFSRPRTTLPLPVGAPAQAPPSYTPSSPQQATPQGPGEYTRMFAAPAPLTLGQPQATPQSQRMPESRPLKRNKSRLPLLLMVGAAVLLILAVIVYLAMRPHTA